MMRIAREKKTGLARQLVILGVTTAVIACEHSPLASGLPVELPDEADCTACHGNANNAAPPGDLAGASDTSLRTVGAHQAHLRAEQTGAKVACAECHPVPEAVGDPGHLDPAPAEVTFGALARTGGLLPQWQADEASCANTYCHGASLEGGQQKEPVWTLAAARKAGCKSCHGAPPPPPHPTLANCGSCHPGVVEADGTIAVANGLHLNGRLDVAVACNDCHGRDADGAPPLDLDGSDKRTGLGVGAHQSHLQAGALRAAMPCDECHRVPEAVGDPGHLYSARPAEVFFGSLAMSAGAFPIWSRDGSPATCADVYCHGATLSGGDLTEPSWTAVDGQAAQCGSCHGLPPPAPHPDNEACEACHSGTVLVAGDDRVIDIDGGLHINGTIEIPPDCHSCHGDATSPAPPPTLDGAIDPSDIGVGAHRRHMEGGQFRQGVACESCHLVPLVLGSPGHIDEPPAEVVFGGLATARGESPQWNRQAEDLRCTNVYCHGASLAGGTYTAPVWTQVDMGQVACGSCHSLPPPAPHPQSAKCQLCHPSTVVAGPEPLRIDLSSGTHINGEVSFY